MNNQAELFLDTYRRLETAAETLVGNNGRSSSILRLAHLPEFSRYREELDYCRQVRNLLTHEAKIDGAYGVTPSDQLLAVLNKVLRQIEDPPTVGEYMTPVSRLVTARLQDTVLPFMVQMEEKGITYLPIIEQNKIVGIFSQHAVFRWLLSGKQIGENVTFAGMQHLLGLEQHKGIRFVSPDLSLEQGKELFRHIPAKDKRVKMLLVTQNGRADRPLLGVVSPYDVLKED